MTAPDLHPEDLLDRELSGELSTQERAHLEAHLKACVSCRFERQARADFAALPMPSMAVEALVTRALAGAPTASAPARRRFSPGVIVAAALLVGAVSFGAIGLARPIAEFLGLRVPETPPVTPHERPRPKAAPLPPPPPPPALEVPAPVEPLTVPPAPQRPVRINPQPVARPEPTAPPPAPLPTAAELFHAATRARTQGDAPAAERLYRELTVRFPGSPEAVTAHAVLGRLLIDLGRAAEAIAELEATLTAVDAGVREDALANRAVAFEALGQAVRARAAWQQLLREFPDSIHARRAKQRLEVLNDP